MTDWLPNDWLTDCLIDFLIDSKLINIVCRGSWPATSICLFYFLSFIMSAWFKEVCRYSHWYTRATEGYFWWRKEKIGICFRGTLYNAYSDVLKQYQLKKCYLLKTKQNQQNKFRAMFTTQKRVRMQINGNFEVSKNK